MPHAMLAVQSRSGRGANDLRIVGFLDSTAASLPHDPLPGKDDPAAPCISRLPSALLVYVGVLVAGLLATALNLLRLHASGGNLLRARLWSADRFGDFWHYEALFPYLHTPAFFLSRERFAYPAPCAIVYQVLYSLGPHKHLLFDLGLWTFELASGLWLLWVWLRNGLCPRLAVPLVLLVALGSHPWHMLYDRGNLEIFLYVLVGSGFAAFLAGYDHLAAALWGTAAAMKIYPVLLLAVFLRKGRISAFLSGLATCAAVLLLSFAYVGPSIEAAFQGTLRGLQGFQSQYGGIARRNELYQDHSLLGSVKLLLDILSPVHNAGYPRVQLVYELTVIAGLPLLWWFRLRHSPALNQVCAFLLLMVLLPTVSYDYTLIHTYLAFGVVSAFYLRTMRGGGTLRHAAWFFLAFVFLELPITWVHLGPLDLNGLLKCLSLIVLVTLLTTPGSDFSPVAPATARLAA